MAERAQRGVDFRGDARVVGRVQFRPGRAGRPGRHIPRHFRAADAAVDGGVGDAVAAQTVGAVRAARVLAGDEQARQFGDGARRAHHAAHQIMRARHHLDAPGRQVETAVGASLDHAGELAAHFIGAEVAHGKIHAAVFGAAPGAHLGGDGAAHDVAGGALAVGIVVEHKAAASAV